jgi:hypothetical protein
MANRWFLLWGDGIHGVKTTPVVKLLSNSGVLPEH